MLPLQIALSLVAVAWLFRVGGAVRGVPKIADLLEPEYDVTPAGMPGVTVIVPARNEANDVRACLQSLLAQDYEPMRVIAVDDRSTDGTGEIMNSLPSERLEVLRIRELPPDWLGKTHAMAAAASHAIASRAPEFLLFTDGDILFRSDSVRRAVAYAVQSQADHLVLGPTTIIKRWDEGVILGFFQILGMWAARPWKVADPKAVRDAIGVGAFNLLRSSAYLQVGGFEALRMEIVEDLGMARRIKLAGLRQRFCFGRGMVNVHWAPGWHGLVGVMTKNIFSAFRFQPALVLFACFWLLCFCTLPFVAVWIPGLALPSGVTIVAIFAAYFVFRPYSGISGWNALLAPFAALAFCYTLLRSMGMTLWQGGVVWRGTFYSLEELRKHVPPLSELKKASLR